MPPTNNATIAFFVGFPQGFTGGQTLLRNPKMTVSVTAEGRLSVAMPNGKDIAGNTATGASVAGTSSLADGQWHNVAIKRRAYRYEVWVDGAKEGESDLTTVATYDDTGTQWYLLDASNVNVTMLDELRFYNAALAQNDIRFLGSLATDGLRVPRDPTIRSDAAAAAIGTIVAHANPDDHAWGVPAVVADPSNGTLYMAADFAREKGANNQSVYWKSTDHGETWTRTGSDASMGALALFRFDADPSGTFRAAGIEPDRNIAWGGTSTDGCMKWGTFRPQSTTPLPSKWYPTFAVSGYARNLAIAGGIYNLDVATSSRGSLKALSTGASNNWSVAALRPGGMAYGGGSGTVAFYAASITNHVNATNAAPVASMVVGRRESENGNVSYRGAVSIRGASRPFGVAWDETSQRFWAVTTYAKDSATPWAQANRLALYCATNVLAWCYCGDIAAAGTPETVGFSNPNVAIVGDDLVVVFGASVNDTTAADAPRDVNASNYILSKRIPNFRSRVPDAKPTGRYLLVEDNSAQRILRLRENEETGEWEPDGYFADGNYTDMRYGMYAGDDITYANGKVWILISGRIFPFNTDGTFTGTYFDLTLDRDLVPSNPNVMGFSYDGRYIYTTEGLVSAPTDSRMYRTDVTTGVTTLFCKSSDSESLGTHLRRLRGIAGLPDGRVAVCNRDANKLLAINSDGTFDQVVWSSASAIQTLYLDRRARKLYAGGFSRNLYCWDLVTGEKKSKGGSLDIIGITGDDRGRVFGTCYNKPASLVDMLADGGALTQYGHRLILNGGNTFQRLCFFDTTPPTGTILIFR